MTLSDETVKVIYDFLLLNRDGCLLKILLNLFIIIGILCRIYQVYDVEGKGFRPSCSYLPLLMTLHDLDKKSYEKGIEGGEVLVMKLRILTMNFIFENMIFKIVKTQNSFRTLSTTKKLKK